MPNELGSTMNPLLGRILSGRYRVDSTLGRGGMAEVYKVWDEQRTAYLALKLLREDLAQDRLFLRRFKREAQTLSKLQHPNIVRFYGLEQDGLLAFMLMDLVKGTSLRAEIFQLDGSPMSIQRILEIMRSVCSALNYAHQQGMIHCDAKPGNILIEESGKLLVTDFGIARMTDAATATMVGMGTPAYMAPEQVRGLDPTPQTDIYSLGVILFEMLTGGERPFTGERATITGSTSEKVRWEQMKLDPPSLKRWNPDITPELEALVVKCLMKDPVDRYGSVLDLQQELEALLVSKEVVQMEASHIPADPPVKPVPIPWDDVQLAKGSSEDPPRMASKPAMQDGIPFAQRAEAERGSDRRKLWAGISTFIAIVAIAFGLYPRAAEVHVVEVEVTVEVEAQATLTEPKSASPTVSPTISETQTPTEKPTRTPKPTATERIFSSETVVLYRGEANLEFDRGHDSEAIFSYRGDGFNFDSYDGKGSSIDFRWISDVEKIKFMALSGSEIAVKPPGDEYGRYACIQLSYTDSVVTKSGDYICLITSDGNVTAFTFRVKMDFYHLRDVTISWTTWKG